MILTEWQVIKASSLRTGLKIRKIWGDSAILGQGLGEVVTASMIFSKGFKTFLERAVVFLPGRLRKKEEMSLWSLKFNLWRLYMEHLKKSAILRWLSVRRVRELSADRVHLQLLAQLVEVLGFRLCNKGLWYSKHLVQFVEEEGVLLEIHVTPVMAEELIQSLQLRLLKYQRELIIICLWGWIKR